MKTAVRAKLEDMRAEYEEKPYSELLKIEWHDLPSVKVAGSMYKPAVFTESYQGNLLLVVQLQKTLFLVWKQTDCLGSVIAESGVLKQVNEEFIWNEIGHP